MSGGKEIAKMSGHQVLVMGDQDARLQGAETQNTRIVDSVKLGGLRTLKIDGRFTPHDTCTNRGAKVVVRLKLGPHFAE